MMPLSTCRRSTASVICCASSPSTALPPCFNPTQLKETALVDDPIAPVRAPELRGTAWLNTARPLSLADLRGKLVLLDFWTYACINCLHVLEDLKYLEQKYAGKPFIVVGVHSPKFTNEDDAESVRQAIVRYGITHPVLLDSGRKTWDAYAVRGWPTLVLLDPRGYLLGQVSGEGNRERLDAAIAQALDLLGEAHMLDDKPLPLRLESD